MRKFVLIAAGVSASFIAPTVMAQQMLIDIDEVSKISYCLGVLKVISEEYPFDMARCGHPHSVAEARDCGNMAKANDYIDQKKKRFILYILARTPTSDSQLASMAALATGKSDMERCIENGSRETDGFCVRTSVCNTRDLPY